MPSSKFKVVPVRRRDGTKGPWIMTAEHKAQQWALAYFKSGEPVRFVLYKPSKHEAEGLLTAAQRAVEKVSSYRLGARMGKKA